MQKESANTPINPIGAQLQSTSPKKSVKISVASANSVPKQKDSNFGARKGAYDTDNLGIVINSSIGNFQHDENYGQVGASAFSERKDVLYYVHIPTQFFENNDITVVDYPQQSDFDTILLYASRSLSFTASKLLTIFFEYDGEPSKWFNEGDNIEDYNFSRVKIIKIFKRKFPIMIKTIHMTPKTIEVDLCKKAGDICNDISKELKFECDAGYSLFYTDNGKTIPISSDKYIPSVTSNIYELWFKRRLFTFSGANLYTLNTAKLAFRDAVNEFIENDLKINEDIALEFAALQTLAFDDKCYHPESKEFDEDISFMLPKSYGGAKYLGSVLNEFLREYTRLDPFNACREGINLVRKVPGFASKMFNCKIILISNKHKIQEDIVAYVSPLSITLSTYSKMVEERISYLDITTVECTPKVNAIVFSVRKGNNQRYEFIGRYAHKMMKLVKDYVNYFRELLVKSTNERKYEKFDPTSVSEENRINLFTAKTFEEENPKSFVYSNKMTGYSLLIAAETNLGIPHNEENEVFIKFDDNYSKWIGKNSLLNVMNVSDGMTIYVIPSIQDVEITLSNKAVKSIKINITKNIEDLTEDVFEKIEQPPLHGFTFFTLEEENERSLDVRFSIPEQTKKFKKLGFRRRFYIISAEVLQSKISAIMAVHDCLRLVVEGKCETSEDDAIKLAVYATYAIILDDPSDAETLTNFDFFYNLIPETMKKKSKYLKSFKSMLKKMPHMEPYAAAKKYLGKVRKLPGFGVESFVVNFQDLTTKPKPKLRKKVDMIISPTNVTFYDGSAKEILFKIGYRFIMNYNVFGQNLILKFVGDNKGNVFTVQLEVEDLDKVMMVLVYNIRIIEKIASERLIRERKERQEIKERINGGYLDNYGNAHPPMNDFYITDKLDNLRPIKMWVDLTETNKTICSVLPSSLKHGKDLEYHILLKVVDRKFNWVRNNQELLTYLPFRGSLMVALPNKIGIVVHHGETKIMSLSINPEDKVYSIQGQIADTLSVNTGSYSLCIKINGIFYPLRENATIPEQASDLEEIYFTRTEIPTEAEFKEMKEHEKEITFVSFGNFFANGKIVVEKELTYELAALLLLSYDKRDVPVNGETVIPAPMQNSKAEKKIRSHIEKYSNYTKGQARNEFMRILIKKETDPKEEYNCMHEKKEAKLELFSNHILFKKEEIAYMNVFDVVYTKDKLQVKYIKEGKPESFIITTNRPEVIADSISNKVFEKYEKSKREKKEYSADVFINFSKFPIKMKFNSQMTKEEIIKKVVENKKLPEDKYSLMASIANKNIWVHDGENIKLPLYNGLKLMVFSNYIPIKIEESSESKEIYIDFSETVETIVKRLASVFCIQYWVGYTLWYVNEDTVYAPLALSKTVPEQISSFDKRLAFRRRYYTLSSYEARSLSLTEKIYREYKQVIMSGELELTEAKGIELTIYSLFSEANTPEEAIKTELPEDVSTILPPNTPVSPKTRIRLASLLVSSPLIPKKSAIRKYILTARQVAKFGTESVKGTLIPVESHHKVKKVTLEFSQFGLHIYGGARNKDIAKLGHGNILYHTTIDNTVTIRITQDSGTPGLIVIETENPQMLCTLLDDYHDSLIPELLRRQSVYCMYTGEPIYSILRKLRDNDYKFNVSRSLGYTDSSEFQYSLGWTKEEMIQVSKYYIGIPQLEKVDIAYEPYKGLLESLDANEMFGSIIKEGEGKLVVYRENADVVVVFNNHPIKYTCKPGITGLQEIFEIGNLFNIDIPLGYSLYFYDKPLNFRYQYNANSPSTEIAHLHCRFFITSDKLKLSPDSMYALFVEALRWVINTEFEIPAPMIASLAALAALIEEENPIISSFKNYTREGYMASRDIEKKFVNSMAKYKGMSRNERVKLYLEKAKEFKFFGCERYSCNYTQEPVVITKKNSVVILSPKLVSIYDPEVLMELVSINIANIVSYDFKDDQNTISYQTLDGQFLTVNIFTTCKEAENIYTYIDGITQIYEYAEQNKIDIDIISPEHENDNNSDDAFDFDNSNYFIDFNDITIPQASENVGVDSSLQVEEGKEREFLSWRATDEGYKIINISKFIWRLQVQTEAFDGSEFNPSVAREMYDYIEHNLSMIKDKDLDPAKEPIKNIIATAQKAKDYPELHTKTAEDLNKIYSLLPQLEETCQKRLTKLKEKTKNGVTDTSLLTLISYLVTLSGYEEKIEEEISGDIPTAKIYSKNPKELIDFVYNSGASFTSAAQIAAGKKNIYEAKAALMETIKGYQKILDYQKKVFDDASAKNVNMFEIQCHQTNLESNYATLMSFLTSFNEDEENSGVYLGDHQKASQAIQNFSMTLPEIEKAIASNKLNEESTKSLDFLKKVITYIDYRIRSFIILLDQNIFNDVARTQVAYLLHKVSNAISIPQKELKKQFPSGGKSNDGEHIIKTLSNLSTSITSALRSISVMNINHKTVNSVAKDVDSYVKQLKGVNESVTKKLKGDQKTTKQTKTKDLEKISEDLKKYAKTLEKMPTKGSTLKFAQKKLITLQTTLKDLKSVITAIEKQTNKNALSTALTKLQNKADECLIEKINTEDISTCIHLAKYQQLQLEMIQLFAAINATLELKEVKAKKDVTQRLKSITETYTKNYEMQIVARHALRERPFLTGHLTKAKTITDYAKTMTDNAKETSEYITKITKNNQFQTALEKTNQAAEAASNALEKAQIKKFVKVPESSTVQKLGDYVDMICEVIFAIAPEDEVVKNKELVAKLNSNMDIFEGAIASIQKQLETPSLDFHEVVENLKKTTDDTKELLKNVVAFNSHEEYAQVFDDASNHMSSLIIEIPPNLSLAAKCCSQCHDTVKDIVSFLNDIINDPEIQENPHGLEQIEEFLNMFKASDFVLTRNLEGEFKMPNTVFCIENLVELATQTKTLSPSLKSALKQNIEKFGKMISEFNIKSAVAVNCMRLLTTENSINVNTDKIALISDELPIETQIQKTGEQVKLMDELIQDLMKQGPITNNKPVFDILSKMHKQINDIELNKFTSKAKTSTVLDLIKLLKPTLFSIIKEAPIITTAINSSSFIEAATTTSINVNQLNHTILTPHIASNTAGTYVKEITPLLNATLKGIDAISSALKKQNNEEADAAVKKVKTLITKNSPTLAKKKVPELQKFADTLYKDSVAAIKLIMEDPTLETLAEPLIKLYRYDENFTGCIKTDIKLTNSLVIDTNTFKDKYIFNIFTNACNIAINQDNSPVAFNPIIEFFTKVQEKPEHVPSYLMDAVKQIAIPIQKFSFEQGFDAARVISLFGQLEQTKNQMQETLICNIADDLMRRLSEVKSQVIDLKEQTKLQGVEVNNELNYYINHLVVLISALEEISISTQNKLESISCAAEKFIEITMHINVLIKYCRTLPQFSLLIEVIVPNAIKIMSLITQEELAFTSLFFSHLDLICIKLEEISLEDKDGKVSPITKPVYANMMQVLKNKSRLLLIDTWQLAATARLFIDFRDRTIKDLGTKLQNNQNVMEINSELSKISPISGIIDLWSKEYTDNIQSISLKVQIMAASICNSISVSYQTIRTRPENFIFTYNTVYQFLSYMALYCNQTNQAGHLEKEKSTINGAFEYGRSVFGLINNQNAAISVLIRINSMIESIFKDAKKLTTLNYEILGLSETDSKESENLLKNIKNPALHGIAKKAADLVKEVKNMQKNEPAKEIKPKKSTRGKSRSPSCDNLAQDSDNENERVIPLAKICESLASVPNSELINNLPKLIRTDPLSILPLAQTAEDNLNSGVRRSIISQRFKFLMLQQNILFPDIQTVDIADNLNKTEVEVAFSSIRKQIEAFGDTQKLTEIQHSLTAKEINIQRRILSSCAEMAVSESSDISLDDVRKQTYEDQASLLGRIVSVATAENQCPPIYSQLENNRTIARYMTVAMLEQQLRSVQIALFENMPDINRFILSSEGAEANVEPIQLEAISIAQMQIKQELTLMKSPEYLKSFMFSIDTVQSIYQLRVLLDMINILTGPFSKNLIAAANTDSSLEAVFNELAYEQLSHAKVNPNAIQPASNIDLRETANEQEALCISTDMLELAEMFHLLQVHQALIANFTKEVESAPMKYSVANRSLSSISKQLKVINNPQKLTEMVKKLSKEQIEEQQQVLKQIISLLTTDSTIDYIKDTVEFKSPHMINLQCQSTLKMLEQMIESCPDFLEKKPEINEIGGISSIQKSFEALYKSNLISLLLSKFKMKYPTIVSNALTEKGPEEVKKAMKQETFNEIRTTLNLISQSVTKAPEEVEKYLSSLSKNGQVVFYGVLLYEMKRIQEEGEIKINSEEFDAASLAQIVSVDNISVQLEDIQSPSFDVKSMRKTLIENKVSEILLNIADIHNKLIPVEDKNDLEHDLKVMQGLSKGDLTTQIQSIKKQISMPIQELENIKTMKPMNAKIQNIIISYLVEKVSQSSSIIKEESEKNISEKEAALNIVTKLLDDVQTSASKYPEKMIAATRLNPLRSKVYLNDTKDIIARSLISVSLQQVKTILLTKEITAYLKSSKGKDALSRPFSKEELIQRQTTLKKMIGGEPTYIGKEMTQRDVVRTLIVAHDMITQLEVEPTHEDIALTLEDLGAASKAKAPSTEESSSYVIQAASNIIKAISSNQESTPEFCKNVVINDIQRVLPILKEMILSPGTWTQNAGMIIESVPNIVALLTVLKLSLPSSVANLLPKDTSSILEQAKIFEMSATDLDDPSKKADFIRATKNLYSDIYAFYGAVSEEPIGFASDLLQSLVENIEAENLANITILLPKIKSLKIQSAAKGRKVMLLDQNKPIIEQIEKIMLSSSDSADVIKLLQKPKTDITNALSTAGNNPFSITKTIKTNKEAKESLLDTILRIKEEFVSYEVHLSPEKRKQKIISIISGVSFGMASAFKGLSVNKTESLKPYMNCIEQMDKAFRTFEEMLKRTSWTSTSINNYQRKLTRIIETSIETIENIESAEKADSPFDKKLVSVSKELSSICESVCNATSVFSSTKTKDSYVTIVGDSMPNSSSFVNALNQLSDNVKSPIFTTNCQKVNLLYDGVRNSLLSNDHDIDATVKVLHDFTSSSLNILSAQGQESPSEKSKLPTHVSLVQFAEGDEKEDLTKITDATSKNIEVCGKAAGSGNANEVSKQFNTAKDSIEKMIRISLAKASTTSISHTVNEVSKSCFKVQSLFNVIVTKVRGGAKCNVTKECSELTASIKELTDILQKEIKISQALPKIVSSLKESNELIVSYKDKISVSSLSDISKQCLTLLLEISVSIIHILISSIASDGKANDKDPMFIFAKDFVKHVKDLATTIEESIKTPANSVKNIQTRADTMSKAILGLYNDSKKSKNVTTEVKDSLKRLGDIAATIKNKVGQKTEAQPEKKVIKANSPENTTKLLERLSFEANVIKARHMMEYLENKLKSIK